MATYKKISSRKFKIGIILLAMLIFVSVVSVLFIPFKYNEQGRGQENLPPSYEHVMGTDALGRDMTTRVMTGILISIGIGLIASIINLTVGLIFGVVAGYVGGIIGSLMMRITDIIASIPEILYLILAMVILNDGALGDGFIASLIRGSHGMISIIITLSVAFWVPFARILRGQVLSLREMDFIAAANVYGASHIRIIFKYILPNCTPLILVTVVSRIPIAIFFEAFLSFIGLGIQAPLPSLGLILAEGLGSLRSAPYLLLFPAVGILSIVFIMNFISDGIREMQDKRVGR